MTTKNLQFGSIKIPVTEYASQGNAILGIRDSGKSYTATYIAERLLEANIPFVAFDPIGIWKYLRVPSKGPGYPVVVAGGRNGDLPLTPHSAPEIVRQAMVQGVPLVLDLYDIAMSKADWKQIVESSVRLLLYENGDYGLRHIFIEEAAEFVPQRIGPDQGRVYAEIEKLARMGGNALLGYTLINQRAEEVNKAVLELCDCLFLHRQKGRNSLQALGKWLDLGSGILDTKPIIQSLPTLPQGECYVWPSGASVPEHVKIPTKNTFHPDRRVIKAPSSKGQNYQALDVSAFVSEMSEALAEHVEAAKANDPTQLKKKIAELERQLKSQGKDKPAEQVIVEVPVLTDEEKDLISSLRESLEKFGELSNEIKDTAASLADVLSKTLRDRRTQPTPAARSRITSEPARPAENVSRPSNGDSEFTAPQQRILNVLSELLLIGISQPLRNMVAFLSNQSPRSSGFKNNLGALRSVGTINYVGGDRMEITTYGVRKAEKSSRVLDAETFQQTVLRQLPMPQARILEVLIECYPEPAYRSDVAEQAGQSPTSSGYKNNLGALRSLGLLDYAGPEKVQALPVMFLE